MARFRNLALVLAIAALVLVAAVDAKTKEDEKEKKLTSRPGSVPRVVKEAPPPKGGPKHVKAPPQNPEKMLPDMRTIVKPGKPKHGKAPVQHTVTTYGPKPAGHRAKHTAKKVVPEKDRHPESPKKVTKKAPKTGLYQKKIPTVYKGRSQTKAEKRRADQKMTRGQRAEKLEKETKMIQDIMNNPTKHKGVKVNHYQGVPHPEWALKKVAAHKNPKGEAVKQQARKRASVVTPKTIVADKKLADKKKASKVLKHEKEAAKAKATEAPAANPLKAAETKKVQAQEHLKAKAQQESKQESKQGSKQQESKRA